MSDCRMSQWVFENRRFEKPFRGKGIIFDFFVWEICSAKEIFVEKSGFVRLVNVCEISVRTITVIYFLSFFSIFFPFFPTFFSLFFLLFSYFFLTFFSLFSHFFLTFSSILINLLIIQSWSHTTSLYVHSVIDISVEDMLWLVMIGFTMI